MAPPEGDEEVSAEELALLKVGTEQVPDSVKLVAFLVGLLLIPFLSRVELRKEQRPRASLTFSIFLTTSSRS